MRSSFVKLLCPQAPYVRPPAPDDGSRQRRPDGWVSNESEPKRRLRDQTDDRHSTPARDDEARVGGEREFFEREGQVTDDGVVEALVAVIVETDVVAPPANSEVVATVASSPTRSDRLRLRRQ